MNQEQVTSIVRQLLLVAGGGLVTKGYVDATTLNTIIGALLVLGGSAWAIYSRRDHGLIASAAAVGTVATIETTKVSTAAAVDSPKVVPAAAAG